MLNNRKKQVNLIIKDQVIRYMVNSQSTIEGMADYGEVFLEDGVIADGKIIDKEVFLEKLHQLVNEKKWKNWPLSFCVPDSSVTIREHLVPKQLKKEEIKSYINMELQDSIRLPFNDPVIDFVITGEEGSQSKILLFAYPRERISDFLQLFGKAGLKPLVADLSSLCLYRLYFQLGLASDKEHLLLIQWGKDSIVLTAFYQKKPVFTRQVKSLLPSANWAYSPEENDLAWQGNQEEIGQSLEEQMVMAERFMDFYQYSVMDGEQQITKVLLTGDFPYLNRVEEFMKENYHIPVQLINELEDKIPVPGKYADVLGLSIKK
ncbi:type IV pilus biogenesis protein PilM [Sediminibacillus albus]|uniref:Type IV pilus assembly protein PilM n=1 Tax=Sediminibacillus albus TaxID=407036 RepID=A0A1G9BNG9_9BACI|nr:pilus assembly protein PilM [Sediminibacillus albus]SDK40943.1 type IV pilus assembly protein PilM [Sediminibacillus albus]